MLPHNLPRHLPNHRPETLQPQTRPFQLCGPQTPHQRTRHPCIRHGHSLVGELFAEEGPCITRLLFADGGEVRVDPVAGSIAVEFAPVGVPGGCAVEGFCDVVEAFAVAGEVEEFVGCLCWGSGDEVVEVGGEELPLS
jgi:hypothetical protein